MLAKLKNSWRFKVIVILLFIFLLAALFNKYTFHFSLPLNECDLKAGQTISIGDLIFLSRDLCLAEKAKKENNISLCNAISEMGWRNHCVMDLAVANRDMDFCKNITNTNDYVGNPEHDRWECVKKVAVETSNLDFCSGIKNKEQQFECSRDTDKQIDYEKQAVDIAKNNINEAIKVCQKFKVMWNQQQCYVKASDVYSGIDDDSKFNNPPDRLITICLNNPNEEEWFACLYGKVFDSLTATEKYIPQFKQILTQDTFRSAAFCRMFKSEIGNYGKGSYYSAAGEIRDQVCN